MTQFTIIVPEEKLIQTVEKLREDGIEVRIIQRYGMDSFIVDCYINSDIHGTLKYLEGKGLLSYLYEVRRDVLDVIDEMKKSFEMVRVSEACEEG